MLFWGILSGKSPDRLWQNDGCEFVNVTALGATVNAPLSNVLYKDSSRGWIHPNPSWHSPSYSPHLPLSFFCLALGTRSLASGLYLLALTSVFPRSVFHEQAECSLTPRLVPISASIFASVKRFALHLYSWKDGCLSIPINRLDLRVATLHRVLVTLTKWLFCIDHSNGENTALTLRIFFLIG